MNALNDKLNNDLRRRRDELTSRKERVLAGGSEAELKRKQKELKSVTRKYTRLTNRLGGMKTSFLYLSHTHTLSLTDGITPCNRAGKGN